MWDQSLPEGIVITDWPVRDAICGLPMQIGRTFYSQTNPDLICEDPTGAYELPEGEGNGILHLVFEKGGTFERLL